MNTLFVRLYPRHRNALAQLFKQNVGGTVEETFTPFPLTSASAEDLLAPNRSDVFFGLYSGRNLVGFSMLRGWDEGYVIPFLGIFIDASHQGKGLGYTLMLRTLEYARERGIAVIRLHVDPRNQSALQLYLKVGFKKVATPQCRDAGASHPESLDSGASRISIVMEWTNQQQMVEADDDR